jgi:hypothetical protein
MNESESIFSRRQLAAELADELMGDSRTGMAWSGLFLSAPRRTGKSTFLRKTSSRHSSVVAHWFWLRIYGKTTMSILGT